MAMYKDMNGRVVRAAPTRGFAPRPVKAPVARLGQARATRVGAPSRIVKPRGY